MRFLYTFREEGAETIRRMRYTKVFQVDTKNKSFSLYFSRNYWGKAWERKLNVNWRKLFGIVVGSKLQNPQMVCLNVLLKIWGFFAYKRRHVQCKFNSIKIHFALPI